MSLASSNSEEIIQMVMYFCPTFFSWCAAAFFCLTRRRENPKGAVYLGLAILVSILSYILIYGVVALVSVFFNGYLSSNLKFAVYLQIGLNTLTTIAFWGLIIAAVFARPVHFDPRDVSMFEE